MIFAVTIPDLIACAAFGAFFLLLGAAIALWSFYTGRSGKSPIPEVKALFKKPEGNGEPSKHTETGTLPTRNRGM